MNHHVSRLRHYEAAMIPTLETPYCKTATTHVEPSSSISKPRKQRVTITLPQSLLERLRNAVYWTGHGPLARLISDALDDAVTQMEQANGQTFPQRLSPLKRGRPRTKSHLSLPLPSASAERVQ